MILYIYSKCSTCQKALRFLTDNKIPFTKKEIVNTPPSLKELKTMLKYLDGNVKKMFNTSGILYRELGLSEKVNEMTEDEALTLLSQNGMLVKRPFLLADNFGLVGFKEEDWCKKLAK